MLDNSMSSTPSSSPSKRPALSPKSSNNAVNNKKSPLGKSGTSSLPRTKSLSSTNSFNFFKTASPSPNKKVAISPSLGFSIWEDSPKPAPAAASARDFPPATSNKLNHNDQENILQPKQVPVYRSIGARKPLMDLSVNKYRGYVTQGSTTQQLTTLYEPANFNNDFKSLHKFTDAPGFVTPSRTNRGKYLVRSLSSEKISGRVQKHSRSMSLGKNEMKRTLIKKNSFPILSNSS
ncbi:uncharacterized protein LODBEIA_P41950 [Lodderomyces beijingensis]|uniref:Uncharacterized protein n=1 Tax=Lodderomyces beijingensis TaxID=1775926 RepID=A0ABP0ZP95_9ASCO